MYSPHILAHAHIHTSTCASDVVKDSRSLVVVTHKRIGWHRGRVCSSHIVRHTNRSYLCMQMNCLASTHADDNNSRHWYRSIAAASPRSASFLQFVIYCGQKCVCQFSVWMLILSRLVCGGNWYLCRYTQPKSRANNRILEAFLSARNLFGASKQTKIQIEYIELNVEEQRPLRVSVFVLLRLMVCERILLYHKTFMLALKTTNSIECLHICLLVDCQPNGF